MSYNFGGSSTSLAIRAEKERMPARAGLCFRSEMGPAPRRSVRKRCSAPPPLVSGKNIEYSHTHTATGLSEPCSEMWDADELYRPDASTSEHDREGQHIGPRLCQQHSRRSVASNKPSSRSPRAGNA